MRRFILRAFLAVISLTGFAVAAERTCFAEDPAVAAKAPAAGVGIWEGTLDVGVAKLRLVFHFDQDAAGAWTGTMDSVDQGANGIPIDTITWDGDSVKCTIKLVKGTFTANLTEDKTQLDGKWTQGQSWPLVLKKVEQPTKVERPQDPKPPFPYREEEVQFEGANNEVHLAGTLTLPEGEGPFPAVIMISGSGQQDRNENLFDHKPFWVIADALTRRGIAVLRVDDRGVGGSTGEVAKATTRDFADDVRAEIRYLHTREEIDAKRIGLIGHSEGGLIAPMVAADNSDVAFLVLLAGPGVTGEEILYRQGDLIARAVGADDATVAKQRAMQEKFFAVVREGLGGKETDAKLREVVEKSYAELSKEELEQVEGQKAAVDQQLKMVQSPWFRFFLTYDPRPALGKLQCPVLVLNGEKDLQVDPKQNLPELRKAFEASGNKQVRIEELKGLNHLFQTCQTGSIAEYAQIKETMAPEVLKLVGDWVVERTKE